MTSAPYIIDGLVGDGADLVRWTGWQIESREKVYSVRAYEHGHTVYMVNFREVPSLPATPLVRKLLDHIQNTGFTFR